MRVNYIQSTTVNNKPPASSTQDSRRMGADGMAQHLKAFVAIAKNWVWFPVPIFWLIIICNFSFMGYNTILGPPQVPGTQNMNIHQIK